MRGRKKDTDVGTVAGLREERRRRIANLDKLRRDMCRAELELHILDCRIRCLRPVKPRARGAGGDGRR